MPYDFTRPNVSHPYTCIEVTAPKEGLKIVTLNRPESLNAISLAEAEDLEAAFQELKFDDRTRVVILTGAPTRGESATLGCCKSTWPGSSS